MAIASTAERAGEYDAIETLKPGEPVFPLQGGDPHAPACVMHWAGLERAAAQKLVDQAATEKSKRKREKLLAEAKRLRGKANNAEEVAWEMQEYQRGEQAAADAAPKSYGGVEHDAERDLIAILSSICDHIYNSVAEMTDAADALDKIPDYALCSRAINTIVVPTLNNIVANVEPRRHLQREQTA